MQPARAQVHAPRACMRPNALLLRLVLRLHGASALFCWLVCNSCHLVSIMKAMIPCTHGWVAAVGPYSLSTASMHAQWSLPSIYMLPHIPRVATTQNRCISIKHSPLCLHTDGKLFASTRIQNCTNNSSSSTRLCSFACSIRLRLLACPERVSV